MKKQFRNKKNQKIYIYLADGIDCTNSRDGTKVVIYHPNNDENTIYVRDRKEFFDKFEKI